MAEKIERLKTTPEDNITKYEREKFYDQFKNVIEALQEDIQLVVLGDFNARTGSDIVPRIKHFNEDIEELLFSFYSHK